MQENSIQDAVDKTDGKVLGLVGMGIDAKIEIRSSDAKDVIELLVDRFCGGISWLVNRDTPHRIAVNEYIMAIQANESLDPQTKAVLLYNAKRDVRRWANLTSVCEKAAEKLLPTAQIEDLDSDWTNAYSEHAENISNEEMQEIWSLILAQECNEPGSIPKLLLGTLHSMGKREADDFTKLASFCLTIAQENNAKPTYVPIVFWGELDSYYSARGLDLDALHRLETLGLINMDMSPLGGMCIRVKNASLIEYFDEAIALEEVANDPDDVLSIGGVTLSYIGEALMRIVMPNKVEGFFEEVVIPFFRNPHKHLDDLFSG